MVEEKGENILHLSVRQQPTHTLVFFLQWQAALGWILCLTLLAVVTIIPYVLEDNPLHPSAPHALYNGTHRSLWALALTWIIVACEDGYGGKQQHHHTSTQQQHFVKGQTRVSYYGQFCIHSVTTVVSSCNVSPSCFHLQLLVPRPINFYYCRFCQQLLVVGFLDPSVQHQLRQLLTSSYYHHSPPVPAGQFNQLLRHQLCEYFQP